MKEETQDAATTTTLTKRNSKQQGLHNTLWWQHKIQKDLNRRGHLLCWQCKLNWERIVHRKFLDSIFGSKQQRTEEIPVSKVGCSFVFSVPGSKTLIFFHKQRLPYMLVIEGLLKTFTPKNSDTPTLGVIIENGAAHANEKFAAILCS